MNPGFAHVLVRLYPRAWRERYGAEFEELLQEVRGSLRTTANVVWSALSEHVLVTRRLNMEGRHVTWGAKAPWAMFGLAPLSLLAGAYLVACLILWSGWKIFLPGTETPFVPIDGLAVFYFGLGRALYYGAPIVIGWAIVVVAARQKSNAIWPVVGLVLTALIGGTSQVHASGPAVPGEVGHVSLHWALGPPFRGMPCGLFHSLVILSVTILPCLIWRFQRTRFLS